LEDLKAFATILSAATLAVKASSALGSWLREKSAEHRKAEQIGQTQELIKLIDNTKQGKGVSPATVQKL
jgi:chorismate-pyruvate lyase